MTAVDRRGAGSTDAASSTGAAGAAGIPAPTEPLSGPRHDGAAQVVAVRGATETGTAAGEAPAGAVRLLVPASSANLGPGFDALGLALGLYDDVSVRLTSTGLTVDTIGADTVPADEAHLVVRSIRATFDELGLPQPGLALRCVNRIPHGRGLGSSAAAIVAGVVAADALAGSLLGPAGLLRVATAIEGHPDNVAAALLGGLTVAWYEAGVPQAVRVAPPAEVRPVLFVPSVRQSTEQARGALPERVPHADAAVNVGRAALLALALSAAEPAAGEGADRSKLLLAATEDRLHQPYRLPAQPASADLVARLRAEGVPAALSGSGPSVVALAVGGGQAAAAIGVPAPGFSVIPLTVDTEGARLQPLDSKG
ncbi:homoserine kinase [Frankia sp. Cpl3]|uniref:homoserine kinase n=1 Tax=Parafrankia colletiae TaxID=573497 RepID=UPI000A8E6F67|nr:homoserine kinase [Parafrankia colletiae]MCK9899669.1 homoserine kinase [Frankia sp. Cpl3]